MKATIITLVLSGLVTLGNITNVSGKNKIYSNTETDPVTNTKTTIVCEGEGDMHLRPISKSIKIYNENDILTERIRYEWDSDLKNWILFSKHTYLYSENDTLESLTYSEWDETTNTWKDNTIHTIYLYDSEGEFLTLTNAVEANR